MMKTTKSQNANQRHARVYKRTARTAAEKNRRICVHVEKVRRADAATTVATWKLADELAILVQVYRECYGGAPSARKVRQLTSIERDGYRLLLYAKLAAFFNANLRRNGVGLRVYEMAYKCNQSLKRQGYQRFTAEQIAGAIAAGNDTADTIRMHMEATASHQDRAANFIRRKANRQIAITHPATIVKNKKRWLRMLDEDPDRAIAAAIAVNDDATTVHNINESLKLLGCNLCLCSTAVNNQHDLFEDEPCAAAVRATPLQEASI